MIQIPTLFEGRRGCGFRKPGGFYIIGARLAEPCSRLPIELSVCPCCGAGVKPKRGWTWVLPDPLLFPNGDDVPHDGPAHEAACPLAAPGRLGDRCGLIWVGGSFYPTPEDFLREAAAMGVSRRVEAIPRGLEAGAWVLLAHRRCYTEFDYEACDCGHPDGPEDHLEGCKGYQIRPAIFAVFRVKRIEYVVLGDEPEAELERLVKRGVTPVRVERRPDNPTEPPVDSRGRIIDEDDDD